ncbi:MAG: glycosyltransferase family 4 protein [Verrucomicrobiae bacterium]|nr:glycosyltransferase family 4 protein [Verrucomicrobiae bacterium]
MTAAWSEFGVGMTTTTCLLGRATERGAGRSEPGSGRILACPASGGSAAVRVLVAGISWPPETFLQRLVVGLDQAGCEVTLGLPTADAIRGARRQGLSAVRMPGWSSGHPMRWLEGAGWLAMAFLRSRRELGKLVRTSWQARGFTRRMSMLHRGLPFCLGRWDVIYFPWNSAAVAHLPVFELGTPVVVSCRGSQVNVAPSNPARRDLVAGLKETFRRAAAVHCVSDDILQEASRLGLDAAKARVIRPAVDPVRFVPAATRPPSAAGVQLVTTGALIWRKGYEYLLLALRRLADRGLPVRLAIIGEGPERERLVYTVQDLGLGDRVEILGRRSPREVRERLQGADCFVFSSLSEGLPNAVLEAMACGLPVVTTDCGGVREAVTDGVEGRVVPARDPLAMAEAIEELIQSPEAARRMGAAGRARVERDFRLEDQVQRFAALFREVAGRRE